MQFLITWRVHENKRHDTLALFSEMSEKKEQSLMGDNVRMVGRWHDLVGCTGAAVYEADSAEDISAYALNWNRFMDLQISVVVDDNRAREIGRKMALNG